MEYRYIDLGLPSGTKWATCNIGASAPTECGDYYMWGSIIPNSNDNCYKANVPLNNVDDTELLDENGNLKPEYDAVYQATGGQAHMPTRAQFEELRDNTICCWINSYDNTGINGILFMPKSDLSEGIFIPASGSREGYSNIGQEEYAALWSSSIDIISPGGAYSLCFGRGGGCGINWNSRYIGNCVRGVTQ